MAKVVVIGLTGSLASGKTAVLGLLSSLALAQGINTLPYSLSDEVRSEVRRLGIPITRDVLKQTADSFRSAYGSGIWGARVAAKVQDDLLNLPEQRILVLVDGIRNPAEVDELRLCFGERFRLLAVNAPRDVLRSNLRRRKREDEAQRIVDDELELDKFIEKELGVGEPEYGHNVSACVELADYAPISNDGSLQDLESKIAKLANDYIFPLYDAQHGLPTVAERGRCGQS